MDTLPNPNLSRPIPFRSQALALLRERLRGRNLYDLAASYGITVDKDGQRNKGWVGQTLERAGSLPISSLNEKDGADFELKSTTVFKRGEQWEPKETIKVTQLNPATAVDQSFEDSVLWDKLSRLILVGVHHPSATYCEAVSIGAVDVTDPVLVSSVKEFWDDIRDLLLSGDFGLLENLGNADAYIQLRPTGDGSQLSLCPVTGERFHARAFYVTKRFVRRLLEESLHG